MKTTGSFVVNVSREVSIMSACCSRQTVVLERMFNSELARFREPEYALWKSSVFSYSPVSEKSRRDSKMRGVGEFRMDQTFRNCNVIYCHRTFILCPCKLSV